MNFIVLQSIATAILFAVQYYLYRKVRVRLAGREPFLRFPFVLPSVFVLFSVPLTVTILYRALGKGLPNWFLKDVMYPVYIWHFICLMIVGLLLAGMALKLPFWAAGWVLRRFERTKPVMEALRGNSALRKFDAGRRKVVQQSFTILAGGAALGSAYELYRSGTYELSTIPLQIKDLPPAFEDFSIGFISDIHSGIFMSAERMRSYAESVNALKPDMIIVTGDFVNLHLDEVFPFKEAFGILSAPHGVYGVLGNHDYYTRQVEDVAREVEKTGISLLRNRFLTIDKNGDSLHLAGIDDTGDPVTAEQGFLAINRSGRPGTPKILLCHRPYFFKEAASAGFDLVLSGHTHGGQVVLGELGRDVLAPARLFSPYISGLYTEGASQMYINRGLGTVSIPIRFNCPPEITKIVLKRRQPVASQAS